MPLSLLRYNKVCLFERQSCTNTFGGSKTVLSRKIATDAGIQEAFSEGVVRYESNKVTRCSYTRAKVSGFWIRHVQPGYWDSQGVYTTGQFRIVVIQMQCFHFKFQIRQEFRDS